MTVVISYNVDSEQAEHFFDYAGYHARHTRTPIARVETRMKELMREQFDTQGSVFPTPGYSGWYPLAEKTILKKGHDRILWETGELEEASIYGVHSGSNWIELRIDRYSRDGYWLVDLMNSGAEGRHQRPVWETTPEFEFEVQSIFHEWLNDLKRLNVSRRRGGGSGGLSVIPFYEF